jgi:2-aminoadipate transaminase
MDSRRLLELSLEENVAFVAGGAFHCDGSGGNTLRLNFSHPDLGQLDVGVRRLARSIRRMIDERDPRAVPDGAARAEARGSG